MKWEYAVEPLDYGSINEQLRTLGNDEWEMVGFAPQVFADYARHREIQNNPHDEFSEGPSCYAVFKRPAR